MALAAITSSTIYDDSLNFTILRIFSTSSGNKNLR